MRVAGRNYRSAGFTLIELIAVLVITAIIATIGMNFFASTMQSYADTQERSRLINRARQAVERMSRQLRGAVPNSVRVTSDGACVEFLPLAGGGNYLGQVPDAGNGAAPSSTISSEQFAVDFAVARYLVIGALGSADIYGGGSLALLSASMPAGNVGNSLAMAAAKQWQRNSVAQRFFLADDPQAFCLKGGELRFHQGYGTPLSSSGAPGGGGDLMADQVSGSSPFSVESGTEVRGSVAIINLLFHEQGQRVNIRQEVAIRNVP